MGLRERWANSGPFTRFVLIWALPAAGAILTAFTNLPAISSAYEAWDSAGLPTVAMRSYVRSSVQPVQASLGQTTQQVKDLQLDIALGKRESYDNERAKWQLELNKATDDQTRASALQQIQRLDRTSDALNEQIRALRGIRGPN